MKLRLRTATRVSIFGLFVIFVITACGGTNATSTPVAVAPTTAALRTPVPGVNQTITQTASYRVEVWSGPALTMMMTSFPIMSSMDQGQAVNRHLKVHIFDKISGDKLTGLDPSVRLTHQGTGVSRELADSQETGTALGASFITACQLSKHRAVEPHFGDNIYLQKGTYTVIIEIAEETAESEITI